MANRKKQTVVEEPKNELAKALEAGKSVVGLVGFIPITYNGAYDEDEDEGVNQVYVKIKCTGIKAEGCNIKVIAELQGGSGTVLISPCQFVDSPKQVEDLRDRARRMRLASKDFKLIGRSYYSRAKKAALTNYVNDQMTEEQAKEFWEEVAADQGLNGPITRIPERMSDANTRVWAKVAVLTRHNLEGESLDNFERFSWSSR